MKSTTTSLVLRATAVVAVLSCSALAGSALAASQLAAGVLSHSRPQSARDAMVAVIQRSQWKPGIVSCPELAHRDVAAIDLRAACGQDVVRELTFDGDSFDPTITGDGSAVAYFTRNASGDNELLVHSLVDGVVTSLLLEAASVTHLDFAPSGDFLVYERSAGTASEVVIVDVAVAAIVATDSGASLRLADERPADALGSVVYAKLVGPDHELFRMDPGGTVTQLTSGTGDHGAPSVSEDGSTLAFVRTVGGVSDLHAWQPPSPPVALTSTGTPGVSFQDVGISGDGAWVAFASHGNLTGGNGDGSAEVFRVRSDGTGLEQLTNLDTTASPPLPIVRGVSQDGRGDRSVILRATSPRGGEISCSSVPGEHLTKTWHESLDTASLPISATVLGESSGYVTPPFDVVDELDGVVPSPGCADNGDGSATCGVVVRNQVDAARSLLLVADWSVETGGCPGVTTRQAIPVDLDAGEAAVVVDTFVPACSPVTGTFRLRALDGSVVLTDRAAVETAFSVD